MVHNNCDSISNDSQLLSSPQQLQQQQQSQQSQQQQNDFNFMSLQYLATSRLAASVQSTSTIQLQSQLQHQSPRNFLYHCPTPTSPPLSSSSLSLNHLSTIDYHRTNIIKSGGQSGLGGGGGVAVPSTSSTSSIGCGIKNKKIDKGPKQGPHCEQFLKKFGMMKTATATATTTGGNQEKSITTDVVDDMEHVCNESYDAKCGRWKFYVNQIETIIKQGNTICIEVFLGPENSKILMEQWIIQLTDK